MTRDEILRRQYVDSFRSKLAVDKHRLDDHLIELPNEMQQITELIGELQTDAALAKSTADRALNQALTQLFSSVDPATNKPFSIERAKAYAEADETYLQALERGDGLRDLLKLAESMLAGMRQKAESCKLLAQLHATGYMAPSATYNRDRADYIAAREQTAARRNETSVDQSSKRPVATRPRPVGK